MTSRIPWRHNAPLARGLLDSPLPTPTRPVCRSAHISNLLLQHSRAAHNKVTPARNPLLNPPASTRPPPLTVPVRTSSDSTFKYLFQLGKSYLRFYKDGLKAVWTNRGLLRDKMQKTPADDRPSMLRPHHVPRSFSRADWVLFWRVRHDLLRLPLFGLMLIVIGEFTALVVIYADGVVPYTCRIPKQLFSSLEKAEQRRKASFDELDALYPHGVLSPRVTQGIARTHVLKSLHLAGSVWDRLGVMPPWMWALKGKSRLAFLEADDKMLLRDGGPMGLEYAELRVACSERGIDILGKSESELKGWLGDWLRLTAAEEIAERRRRMSTLLLTRPEHWPENRDFAVPGWEL